MLSASGFGRTPVAEVMLCNPAIRNLIRSAKTHQIYSLIQTGAAAGMQTMDQGLAKAVQAGTITEAMAFDRCHDPSELRDYLRSAMTTDRPRFGGLIHANHDLRLQGPRR